MEVKTSQNHPLNINFVELENGARIGMTICPGKYQPNGLTGAWDRDLKLDIERLRDHGVHTVVSLIEDHEFEVLRVGALPRTVREFGLDWLHLPIIDRGIPDESFERTWRDNAGPLLHQRLDAGRFIVLHCMGGLGRTGTIAARLLVERGDAPEVAIRRVRAARPGTIETNTQQKWLHDYGARLSH